MLTEQRRQIAYGQTSLEQTDPDTWYPGHWRILERLPLDFPLWTFHATSRVPLDAVGHSMLPGTLKCFCGRTGKTVQQFAIVFKFYYQLGDRWGLQWRCQKCQTDDIASPAIENKDKDRKDKDRKDRRNGKKTSRSIRKTSKSSRGANTAQPTTA